MGRVNRLVMQTMSVKYANILCIINIPRQKLIEEFTIKPC